MSARNLIACAAATSLAATPLAAQNRQAEVVRQSEPASAETDLGGSNSLFFYLGIAAVALGIVLLIDDDDAASP